VSARTRVRISYRGSGDSLVADVVQVPTGSRWLGRIGRSDGGHGSTPHIFAVRRDTFSEEDRQWLTERLAEYKDLLVLLRAKLKPPTVATVVALNQSVRHDDEWLDELDRIEGMLILAAASAVGHVERRLHPR
jgi:hypothetical protein